jgi:glucoamylase
LLRHLLQNTANSSGFVPVRSGDWLTRESRVALAKIDRNFSPTDGSPGSIIAAQTRDPGLDYYFHWVRDAAETVDAIIVYMQEGSLSAAETAAWTKKINDYVQFSAHLQSLPALGGLGEAKFFPKGTLFNEPWGRPQNDGPASRAVSEISWAKQLGTVNTETETWPMVRLDLDHVVRTWDSPSFDIWEDVKGLHFYNFMVSRRALRQGAALAEKMGDHGRARAYILSAEMIEAQLRYRFWNAEKGILIVTLPGSTGGFDSKASQLDLATILGILHGSLPDDDPYLPFLTDPRMLATVERFVDAFRDLYKINRDNPRMAPALGRYPEDTFAGVFRTGGNPWFIANLAVGEFYYRSARAFSKLGQLNVAQEKLKLGDGFVDRAQRHAGVDGTLYEQFRGLDGYMTSVVDLTWSYAAVLSAHAARKQAQTALALTGVKLK